jgi:hypothetical protein
MNDMALVELQRPAGVGRYEWQPYLRDNSFTYGWWHRLWDLSGRYSVWSARLDGVEVARVELDDEVSYDHYTRVPALGPSVLEVDFFEVSSTMRCRGIGRQVLRGLARRFPDRSSLRLARRQMTSGPDWDGLDAAGPGRLWTAAQGCR